MGLVHGQPAPSVEPFIRSRASTKRHWKGVPVHQLSSDSETSSLLKKFPYHYSVSSCPLKRHADLCDTFPLTVRRYREASPQPSCSFHVQPDSPAHHPHSLRDSPEYYKCSKHLTSSELPAPTNSRQTSADEHLAPAISCLTYAFERPAPTPEPLTPTAECPASACGIHAPSSLIPSSSSVQEDSSAPPKRQLTKLMGFLKKSSSAPESKDESLSPVSSGEEEIVQDTVPSSAYSSLRRFFLDSFPDFFMPASPTFPAYLPHEKAFIRRYQVTQASSFLLLEEGSQRSS